MSAPLRLLSVAACAAVTLGAAGCGEGEEGDIRSAIEEAFTSTDPTVCTELVTRRYVEERFGPGQRGQNACENGVQQGNVESVDITGIEIEDGSASAEVEIAPDDGHSLTLEVGLVEEDGAWKVDSWNFEARLRERLRELLVGAGLPAEQAECAVAGLGEEISQLSSRARVDQIPPPMRRRIAEVTRECVRAG